MRCGVQNSPNVETRTKSCYNVYTYHSDKNRMNTMHCICANSIIERVRVCARLKKFSKVDSKSAKADM